MPIQVSCDCGRSMRVKDEYAGKRARCPGCSAVLVVPAAEPEDFPLDVIPVVQPASITRKPAPPPPPPARRPRDEDEDDERPSRRPARAYDDEEDDEDDRPRRRSVRDDHEDEDEDRPRKRKKIKKKDTSSAGASIGGGLLMMLLAVVWFVVGLYAGWIFYYPPVLFVLGLIAVIKGLAGG